MLVPDLELLKLGPISLAESAPEDGTPEDLYSRVLETICGVADDSQAVEMYDGTLGVPIAFVSAHQSAVAQVQWNSNLAAIFTNPGNVSGVRWGSGTMISPDLFLTAGHLFDQTGGGWNRPRQNGTTNIISPQDIAMNMHLNFNFQVDSLGNPRIEQSFAITQLVEYRLGGIDFAICRIAGNPGNVFGWTTVSTVDAAVNDMLAIIGHPAGLPKRIEAGPTTAFSGNQIQYSDIDTLGGNSGSGILRAADGQLVGVHTNGGCNAAGTGSNIGMRISSIRAQSPTIVGLGTGVATSLIADLGTSVASDLLRTIASQDKTVLSDVGTSVVRDILGTLASRDKTVISDVGTSAIRDVLTLASRDVLGTTKAIDDVKHAGLDKQPGFENKGGFDIPRPIDPVRIDPVRVARPFVLATPHHSRVGLGGQEAQTAEPTRGEYEAVLAQLEVAIAQREAASAELDAQYRAVYAEYQDLLGGPTA